MVLSGWVMVGTGKYNKQLWQCLVMASFGNPESAQLPLVMRLITTQ